MWSLLTLKPKLIFAGLVLALLAILFGTHKVIVYKATTRAVAETRATMSAEYNQKLLEASERAREREHVMVESADKIRKEKDAKIASLNGRLSVAVDSLRQRPQRNSPSSSKDSAAPCSCQGATGAELSREDATVLVREAARADKLRSALEQCYQQYDSVRNSMK